MLKRILFATGVLAIAFPAGQAMARDYDDWGRHGQDHEEHGAIHDEVDQAHDEAHYEGFQGRGEHRGYHRALGQVHNEFHDDHPNTRHDGYRLPSRRGGGYYRGHNPYGYQPYGYRSGSVTFSVGRGY